MEIRGKTAVVTGGSRGIGRAIALRLASEGANIAIISSGSSDAAEKTALECQGSFGVKAGAYTLDVSDFSASKETVAKIKSELGSATILVNNAGITRDGLAAMTSESDFDAVIGTNLKGAFNMVRHMLGVFIRERQGCIVNISSVSGIIGNAGQCSYSASKAGLIGLTKSLAKELAPRGIRCNAVAPGFIKTDMTSGLDLERIEKAVPLGRLGSPQEVADAAVFLIKADYITGEVVRVDGGIAI